MSDDDQAQKPETREPSIERDEFMQFEKPDAPAREWAIANDSEYDFHVTGPDIKRGDKVHVIEKSAYDALLEEKSFLENQWRMVCNRLEKEQVAGDVLAKRVAELEALLEPTANKYYFEQMHKYWNESIAAKAEIERHISEKQQFVNQRNHAESELSRANQRIKALELNAKGLEKENVAFRLQEEREQRLVAALEKINSMFFGLQWDGLGEKKSEAVRKIRELLLETLKAHNGEA